MEVLSTIIYSDFGIFKKPDVNINYLTYEFIPKPMVLGILGAIAGFSGYSTQEKVPEYHQKLKDLRVGIQPLKLKPSSKPPYSPTDFCPRESSLQKTFVTYNNYHGYGYGKENLPVKEQILIQPAFRIFIEKGECEEKDYGCLRENILKTLSAYTSYMGKNEFLLSVIWGGVGQFESLETKRSNIDTIFFNEIIKEDVWVLIHFGKFTRRK